MYALIPLLALLGTLPIAAQQQRPGNPTGGTLPSSNGPAINGPSSPTSQGPLDPIPGQRTGQAATPVFFSGKVMVNDGTPPQSNIAIQRVCAGSASTVAYTDSKGRFSFQWGNTNDVLGDASTSGGSVTGTRRNSRGSGALANQMMNCDLRASLPGFRSDAINLSNHRALDNPDVGTIMLHRLDAVEGTSISVTSLNAPKDAQKAWEKGVQSLQKNKPADAVKDLDKAVWIYPRYAQAWLDLGKAHLVLEETGPAREAFLKATESDARLVDAWVQLGLLASREPNWKETARYLDEALRLDPVDFPEMWFLDAVAHYNTASYDPAERSVRAALKVDPEQHNPRAIQLLGLVLAKKRDYPGAADALREYLRLAPDARDLGEVKRLLSQITEGPAPK